MDILCIKSKEKIYAVEFQYVREICKDMQISKIPGLPMYYTGVCNYKGIIVPIIQMEDFAMDSSDTSLVLILKLEHYYLGLNVPESLYTTEVGDEQKIKTPDVRSDKSIQVEKGIYSDDGNLITVLDVEVMVNRLINAVG